MFQISVLVPESPDSDKDRVRPQRKQGRRGTTSQTSSHELITTAYFLTVILSPMSPGPEHGPDVSPRG